MKITIIGASGFVGTRLINLLKDCTSFDVTNIDKQQSHFHPEITTIANVLDKNKLTELLVGTDLVVLLAAEHFTLLRRQCRWYAKHIGSDGS